MFKKNADERKITDTLLFIPAACASANGDIHDNELM